jgi:hypothetical protein
MSAARRRNSGRTQSEGVKGVIEPNPEPDELGGDDFYACPFPLLRFPPPPLFFFL